jgi:hypothetical protein
MPFLWNPKNWVEERRGKDGRFVDIGFRVDLTMGI